VQLTELRVIRMPGIPAEFGLPLQPGVNLITGPNGSGKSSLARALFNLLWPELAPPPEGEPWETRAAFVLDGQQWLAETSDGRHVRWFRQGQPSSPPDLPSSAVAPAYRLGLLDLHVSAPGPDDRELAGRIRRQMDGGFDPASTTETLFRPTPRLGYDQKRQWLAAGQEVSRLQGEYRQLDQDRLQLDRLKAELADARQAGLRQRVWSALLEIETLRRQLTEAGEELAAFPSGVSRAFPEDPDKLRTLRTRQLEVQAELRQARSESQDNAEDQSRLTLANSTYDPLLAEEILSDLSDTEKELEQTRVQLAGHLGGAGGDEIVPEPVDADTYHHLQELIAEREGLAARVEMLQAQLAAMDADDRPPLWPALLAGIGGLAWLAVGVWRWLAAPDQALGLVALLVGTALLTGCGVLAMARLRGRKEQWQQDLHHDLEQARLRLAERDEQLTGLGGRHGLDLRSPSLLHDLKNLDLRLAAQNRAAELAASVRHLEERLAAKLALLNENFAGAGEPAAQDTGQARARFKDLARRLAKRETLALEAREINGRVARHEDEARRLAAEAADIFRRLDLDPEIDADGMVQQLAEQVPRHRATRDQVTRLEAAVQAQEVLLAGDAELVDLEQARALSPDELARKLESDRRAAANLERLQKILAHIEENISRALAGDTLEKALAQAEKCRQELADRRDEVRHGALGRLLMDRVEQQSETRSRPPILDLADSLLLEFTGRRHGLLTGTGPDGQVEFRARDLQTDRVLQLRQLSDGTRAQLLLAVRLGYLLGAEQGARPPLVLDDCLSASDPGRFTAVATALGELARQQERQILFLTPDPVDVMTWLETARGAGQPDPFQLDLAEIRQLSRLASPAQRGPAAVATIPEPGDLSPAEYAAILGVPELDPWAAPASAHLFYLLRDRLDLLHRLAQAGCLQVGPYLAGRSALQDQGLLSPTEVELLEGRVQIWDELLAAWRLGRARPLTMRDLDESRAFSETMRQRVEPLLAQVKGNAPALLAALRDRQVANLRVEKINQLQEYLELAHLWPAGPVLAEEELLLRVVGSPLVTTADMAAVRELTLLLARTLEASRCS
jgi:exonuclease SbcC